MRGSLGINSALLLSSVSLPLFFILSPPVLFLAMGHWRDIFNSDAGRARHSVHMERRRCTLRHGNLQPLDLTSW